MSSDKRAQIADVYRRHAASVYRRALSLLGHPAEANEVLQDLFVAMLERPEQFEGRSMLSTYLYQATTHACLNRLRDQRNRTRLLVQHQAERGVPAHEYTDHHLRLRQALERLPAVLAEVAVYYFVDDLSQREIAEILGCSRRHVGDLLERLETWGRDQEATCSTN
jgi:RNA polymerase sigma-70 factor (ECF subfamily)